MNATERATAAYTIVETSVHPRNHLAFLSQREVDGLIYHSDQGLYPLIRSCALAVLNSGLDSDDSLALFSQFSDFNLSFERHPRGLKLTLHNAPAHAFVDGDLIETVHDHLFTVLRDLIHVRQLQSNPGKPEGLQATNLVFQILRNAKVLESSRELACIVCWGGHSVNQEEYEYSKAVGRELGLRLFDICTGCGPGAMKGPMRGALYAHRRQGHTGRFIGISEPGIIAAEPPNGVVSDLVILPDIEKRLEAFVRIAHGIVIFPGGPGTFEELLYLVAILSDPRNSHDPLPVILTGPKSAEGLLNAYMDFIKLTLGPTTCERLEVIIDDPVGVAKRLTAAREHVRAHRMQVKDAYYYNWTLTIPQSLQAAFEPTHATMTALDLDLDQPKEQLAVALRCLFSGIVAGNVKPNVRQQIETHGSFIVHGESTIIDAIDALLAQLISQKRMKIHGGYEPCYQLQSRQ